MTISPISSQKNSTLSNLFSNRVTLVAVSVLAGIAIGWTLKTYFTRPVEISEKSSSNPAMLNTNNSNAKPHTEQTAKFTADDIMRLYEISPKRVSLWLPDDYTCTTNNGVVNLEADAVEAFLIKLSDKIVTSQNADDIAHAVAIIDRVVSVEPPTFVSPRFKLDAMKRKLFKWTIGDQEYALTVTENNWETLKEAYLSYLILTNQTIKTYLDRFESAAQDKNLDKCQKYWNWFVDRKYGCRAGQKMQLERNGLKFSIKVMSKHYFAQSVPEAFNPNRESWRTFKREFSVDRDFANALETL